MRGSGLLALPCFLPTQCRPLCVRLHLLLSPRLGFCLGYFSRFALYLMKSYIMTKRCTMIKDKKSK
ncbi:unnamed protein product [Boreogadus saida]